MGMTPLINVLLPTCWRATTNLANELQDSQSHCQPCGTAADSGNRQRWRAFGLEGASQALSYCCSASSFRDIPPSPYPRRKTRSTPFSECRTDVFWWCTYLHHRLSTEGYHSFIGETCRIFISVWAFVVHFRIRIQLLVYGAAKQATQKVSDINMCVSSTPFSEQC